ncbi:MAG: hypothetical protein HYV63_17425 [Candidatus Schekmanbacteria bacterium]|nr:hypothetical protein [Candidatus Schekmanbacteria bacterium]
MAVNERTERIIGAALQVHRELVPGLLESAYEDRDGRSAVGTPGGRHPADVSGRCSR